MTVYSRDVVPLTLARARFSELADEAHAGSEKIITKNGESYVAIIDAARLDYYRELEQERLQVSFMRDVERAMDDVEAGRVMDIPALVKGARARRSSRKKRG